MTDFELVFLMFISYFDLVNTTPTGETDYYDDTDEDDYEEEYSSENSTTNGLI